MKHLIALAFLLIIPQLAMSADPIAPSTAKENTAVAQPVAPTLIPPAKAVKIGYIDISKIGLESEYGKSVKTGLVAKKDKLQAKVMAKQKQVEKMKQSIESKLASLSPQQREAKSKEFQKKVEELRKLAQDSEEELMKLQASETNAVYDAIEKAVSDYGKTTDLSLIIIKKELLYLANGVETQDLTDTIMKTMNETRKKP